MSEVTGIHQLVVRRRRDEQLPYPECYDEFIGQTPTGKIVLGYRVVNGVVVYDYAPTTVEELIESLSQINVPEEKSSEKFSPTEEQVEEAREISAAFDARNVETTERFVVSFDWHYGSEEVIVSRLEDAEPTRKGIEAKYRGFTFSNWKVRREVFYSQELDMWREEQDRSDDAALGV